jgi:hypothetical protein
MSTRPDWWFPVAVLVGVAAWTVDLFGAVAVADANGAR